MKRLTTGAGVAFAVAALVLALSTPGSVHSQDGQDRAAVFGTWALDSPSAERRIDAAIVRVTSRMGLLISDIAHRRLSGSLHPEREVRIARDGARGSEIRLDGGGPVRVSLDGRDVRARATSGESLIVSVVLGPDGIVLDQRSADGGRQTRFSPLASDRMMLQARVYSTRLPADIVYQLEYRRVR